MATALRAGAPARFCPYRGLLRPRPEGERLSLPAMPTEPEARRLGFGAAGAAVFWIAYLGLSLGAGSLSVLGSGVGVVAAVASLAMAGYALRGGASAVRLHGLGSSYFLLTAMGLALAEFSVRGVLSPRLGVSWSAIWIALFPLLVPSGPRMTLVHAGIAASMGPLAFFFFAPHDPSASYRAVDLAMAFAPGYLAGLVAHVGAKVLSRLGEEVADARDMGMYELEARIAQGGMGEVWRAHHRLLSRPAAVKLIRHEPGVTSRSRTPADSVAEQRFEREAQVTASLNSPHTVELYDYGVTDSGTIYYVMELLEGSDLEELVHRHGPLPPERVVHLLKQALDSLAEAHEHGLVHRDIKPANLHVSRRGLEPDFVKVLDFGLVKGDTPGPTHPAITAANGIVGTPAYLAPEIISGDHAIDGRADLYSLGCVAYYLLTGRLVFEGGTAMQMAIQHVTAKPSPPSLHAPGPLPAALDEIVLRCLEKRPEDRPANAVELLRMLEQIDFSPAAPRAERIPPRSSPKNALN